MSKPNGKQKQVSLHAVENSDCGAASYLVVSMIMRVVIGDSSARDEILWKDNLDR